MKRGKRKKKQLKVPKIISGKKRKKINWKILISSFVIVAIAALLGTFLSFQGIKSGWYASIKPEITPPNWVFSFMWTAIFSMITSSLYLSLISAKNKFVKIKVYTLFGFNLLLNILWTFFYFYLRNPIVAYFDLIMLLASIAMLISFLWKVSKKAAWLLVPYFLWVGLAGILNYLSAFS